MIQTQICASLFLLCGASGGSSNAAHHLRAPGRSWGVLRAVVGGLGRVILSKTKIMQHKIAKRCDLEPCWAHLGALLEPSWGHLGARLAPSWGILGPSWVILGDLSRAEDEIVELPKSIKNIMKTYVFGHPEGPKIGQVGPQERPSGLQEAT